MRKIIKLFEKGNVSVCGLRGDGKDMLFANVAVRRKGPYISNTDYGKQWIKFDPKLLDCNNTYRNFLDNKIQKYVYPYPDGIDIYISDGGVYMPSQYQGDLCKQYPYIPTYMALSRHLGDNNVHFNVQNLNRMWDKVREQSDIFIRCTHCYPLQKYFKKWFKLDDNCKWIPKLVIQRVIIYDKYQSAVDRVPVFSMRKPLLNRDRIQQWEIQKQNYDIVHGEVRSRILIYWNKSNYNTRIFKEMMENA